jgi:hypothetical protein
MAPADPAPARDPADEAMVARAHERFEASGAAPLAGSRWRRAEPSPTAS